MAAVSCKKCKKEVNKKDKVCAHCGVSRPGEGRMELLAGLAVVGIAVTIGMTMCSSEKNTDAAITEPASVEAPAPQNAPPAASVLPTEVASAATITAADATAYIAALDAAIQGAAALRNADLKTLSGQSQHMRTLKLDGEKFGTSVFDKPFGYCYGAGIQANSWWQAQLAAAQNGGVERVPDEIAGTAKQYNSYRAACLEAAGSKAS